jgi:hypothetical protein
VHGDRELDDPEVRAEVPTPGVDRADEEFPDLAGQLDELVITQLAKIAGLSDGFEHGQSRIGSFRQPVSPTVRSTTLDEHFGPTP